MSALTMMMMTYTRAVVRARIGSERGASVIEYALLLSLIAIFCVGALTLIGGTTDASISDTADKLP